MLRLVSLLSQVGKDANASLLRDALSDAGVRLDHLKEVNGPSGTAVILLQPSGATAHLCDGSFDHPLAFS